MNYSRCESESDVCNSKIARTSLMSFLIPLVKVFLSDGD